MTSAPDQIEQIRPPLVTIHGINSSGAWQESLRPVFAPHFRYIPISYRHYRFFGATKLLVEPLILVAFAGALLIALMAGARPSATILATGGVVVLVVAHFATALRRRHAFVAVLRQFDGAVVVGEKPFLIAHSLGTYLTGRLLQRHTTRCSRVVFAGSVLSREFPTKRLPQRGEMPFEDIRNELGVSDRVVKLAGFVRRLVPNLGDAGVNGFAGDGDRVHEIDGPDKKCSTCGHIFLRPSWLIHNVKIEHYTHSDHFITAQHALRFWLPTLWGIDVPEFRDWLEWCRVASLRGHGGTLGRAAPRAEKQLLARHWSWADDSTIENYIVREFPSAAAHVRDPVTALRIYSAIWNAVVRACDCAVTHEDDATRMTYAQALDPRMAVRTALGVVAP